MSVAPWSINDFERSLRLSFAPARPAHSMADDIGSSHSTKGSSIFVRFM
jgi:hypothetical protein